MVNANFAGDPDFDTTALKKVEEREAAQFNGGFFFSKLHRLDSEVNSLVSRMERALNPFDGASSDKFNTKAVFARVNEFLRAANDAVKLIDQINDSTSLFSAQNLTEIVQWANKRSEVRVGAGVYKLQPGTLLCEFPSGPPNQISFPEAFPSISTASLPSVIRAISGINSDQGDSSVAPDVNVA